MRAALVALLMVLPRAAHADDARWYGAPILVGDFVALGVTPFTGFQPQFAVPAAVAFTLVPPVAVKPTLDRHSAGVTVSFRL